MFALLSSFWLVALAGLAVPIAIHLWNKKQPRLIKVGSIKWLQASASKRLNSIKLQDWPLLLLRCSLLAVLVLFLCQPVWRKKEAVTQQKNIFISPGLLTQANMPAIQSAIDSALLNGYILHYFNPDFALINIEEWTQLKAGEIKSVPQTQYSDNWSLAQTLDRQFAHASENIVFLQNNLTNYAGNRAVLSKNTRLAVIPVNKKINWVQEAYLTGPDSVTFVVGRSEAEKTTFQNYRITLPAQPGNISVAGLPPLRFDKINQKYYIYFAADSGKTEITRQSLQIALVLDDNRKEDAPYVRATLGALQQYTSRPISLDNNSANANWIFWLSDKKIPAGLLKQTKNGLIIFKDAPAQNKTTAATWFSGNSFSAPITFTKQIRGTKHGIPVWQNNFGEPILTFEKTGAGGIYTFNSRFNAAWNGLPESTLLPELFSSLLFEKQQVINPEREARILDNAQLQPEFTENTGAKPGAGLAVQSVKNWFLVAAVFLFLLERVWAYFKTRVSV